jgi:hypothetical protein
MQIIWRCSVHGPKEYLDGDIIHQLVPDAFCPRCGSCQGLHCHGDYKRWVTTFLGVAWHIRVARFLLPGLPPHRQLFATFCSELPPPAYRSGRGLLGWQSLAALPGKMARIARFDPEAFLSMAS